MNRKHFYFFLVFFITSFAHANEVISQVPNENLRSPESKLNAEENSPTNIQIKDFSNSSFKITNTNDLSLDLRLRISLDNEIDMKKIKIGDHIKAHVIEDFYLPTSPKTLIVQKGSWIRGRINFVKKPSLITMVGEVSTYIDQITTPEGEIIPLFSEIKIQKGYLSENGFINQFSDNPSYVDTSTDLVNSLEVSSSEVNPSLIANLVKGTLAAVHTSPNDIYLNKGQELQLVLKKKLVINKT